MDFFSVSLVPMCGADNAIGVISFGEGTSSSDFGLDMLLVSV